MHNRNSVLIMYLVLLLKDKNLPFTIVHACTTLLLWNKQFHKLVISIVILKYIG